MSATCGFFAQSLCITLRYVLLELAESVGLEMKRFAEDFDRGATKYQVLQEAQEGWEHLHVAGSPTFVLPSGKQISDIGLPDISIDPTHPEAAPVVTPAPTQRQNALEIFRQMMAEASY